MLFQPRGYFFIVTLYNIIKLKNTINYDSEMYHKKIKHTLIKEKSEQGPNFPKILWRTYKKLMKKSDLRKT